MKTPLSIPHLLVAAVASLCPLVKFASAVPAAPLNAFELDPDTLRGLVAAKTDTSLTVNEKVITTTLATTFMKEGKAVTMKEIQVGDLVKVVTSKSGDNKLQAVSIEVLPKEKNGRFA